MLRPGLGTINPELGQISQCLRRFVVIESLTVSYLCRFGGLEVALDPWGVGPDKCFNA